MTIILIKDISWNFLQSCKHESWVSTAKYLMDDVPVLLRSDDVKDIDKVLNVVFTSLPSKFGEFIKWVAEVRRQEDGGQNLSQEEKGRLAFKVFVHFFMSISVSSLAHSESDIYYLCFKNRELNFLYLTGRGFESSTGGWPF